ncbi:MFS transporter [Calditrichota bacterium]
MDLKKHHTTAKEDKLPFIQKFGYGMGALVTIVSVNSLMNLTSLVYIDMLKMTPVLFGLAAAIPRVWDFISDPIAGNISDNTRSRFGRRIPYILVGGVLVGIAFAAVFWVPDAEDQWVRTRQYDKHIQIEGSKLKINFEQFGEGFVLPDSNDLVLSEISNDSYISTKKTNADSAGQPNPTLFRLTDKGDEYTAWFETAREDGKYFGAQTVISGNILIISSDQITEPQRLQLAWSRTTPIDAGEKDKNTFIYLLIMSLLFYTAVTIYSVPHGALGFEMTDDYHERTRVFAYASFIGNVGAITSPWLYAFARLEIFANEIQGIRFVCVGMGLILIIAAVICAVTCRERNFYKIQKQERAGLIESFKVTCRNITFVKLVAAFVLVIIGFQFVMGFSNFIMIYYVFLGDKDAASILMGWNGTIWAVTGLVGVLPMAWISSKIGKKMTVIFSFMLLVIGNLLKIVCYNQALPWLTVIPTVLLSWGMVMCFSLVNSMNADICDEDELNTGSRREGSYYAIYGWWWKAAVSIAYVISGYLLQATGYNADFEQQSESTLFWLRFWEIGLPAVLCIIAILLLSRYQLTEARVYEIKELLKRRTDDHNIENEQT